MRKVTDLFAPLEQPKRINRVGGGNANFLADLADNVSDEVMRERWKAGEYEPIHMPSVAGWRRLSGRSSKGNG